MGDYQKLKLAEASRIASAVLRGNAPILEAAPRLWRVLNGTKLAMTEAHLFFNGIASETDDLPFGPLRELWCPEALKRKDAEAAAYESQIRDKFLSLCREVIQSVPIENEEIQS